MKAFRADLKLAGIPTRDAKGLYADFHALRGSLNTMMLSAGVPLRIAQTHMRHKDPRLTAGTYTDENLLPVAAAVTNLPGIPEADAHAGETIPLRATGTVDSDPQQIPQQSAREKVQRVATERVKGAHADGAPSSQERLVVSRVSDELRGSAKQNEKAGGGARTRDIHVGNVTLYH